MKTYPIALELTVWFDLGLNQYEVVIDETSKLSIKRTDDVLHNRDLTSAEVEMLLDAIAVIKVQTKNPGFHRGFIYLYLR